MKYILMEKMLTASSESWIDDLTLKEAQEMGKKSNFEIVKIFTDDKKLKLIEVIKEYNFEEKNKNDSFRKKQK